MVEIGECYNILTAPPGSFTFRPAAGEHFIVMAVGSDFESANNKPNMKVGLYDGANTAYIFWPSDADIPFTKFMINHDAWLTVANLQGGAGATTCASLMRIR